LYSAPLFHNFLPLTFVLSSQHFVVDHSHWLQYGRPENSCSSSGRQRFLSPQHPMRLYVPHSNGGLSQVEVQLHQFISSAVG
jgi:hypothetical protein